MVAGFLDLLGISGVWPGGAITPPQGSFRDLQEANGVWLGTGAPIPVVTEASAVQRDATTTFLVDVTFRVYDADTPTLVPSLDYSLAGSGGPWFPATPQPFDRRHTSGNPLSLVGVPTGPPGKEFVFVWRAFDDLPEGSRSLHLRIRAFDGIGFGERIVGPVLVSTDEAEPEDPAARAIARRAAIAATPLDFLGAGPILPFERRSRDFNFGAGIEVVRSCVRQILLTRAAHADFPGELPWRPDFGSKLWVLRHRAQSPTLEGQAAAFVREALLWEPRVQVTDVFVEREPFARDNELRIRVRYEVITDNVEGNRVNLPTFEESVPV